MFSGVMNDGKSMDAGAREDPDNPVITVSGLTIERDGHFLLDRLDWKVERGEHWVILGPNGSGKTSLLSALTGYLMPSAGEIRVLGEVYGESDWRELRKRVGLVSSSIAQKIAGGDSALETVIGGKSAMLGHWGRILKKDRDKALGLLELVHCAPLANRTWRVLSQGERQRVLIARALMADPALLILDEPCAGLDPVAREMFLRLFEHLAATACAPALVLVTHHVEEITPSFGHVLLLRAGAPVAMGPARTTLTSRNVSVTFGASVRVRKIGGKHMLRITPDPP